MAPCGKLVLLDKLLPKLQQEKHRVLIFSHFKIMYVPHSSLFLDSRWPWFCLSPDSSGPFPLDPRVVNVLNNHPLPPITHDFFCRRGAG